MHLSVNPFLALGIDENSSEAAVEEAFRYLSKNLNPTNFQRGSLAESQAQSCVSRIVSAYQSLRDAESREKVRRDILEGRIKGVAPEDLKPFIGHLCVAAGIITIDDLNEAISKQSDIDLPLGQILQERALLSQTELEGLLMGQRLYGAPTKPLDTLTQRLIALSAVSKDMVKIVLIDQRTNFFSSLPDLLIKRGWLAHDIFQILQDQPANHTPSTI